MALWFQAWVQRSIVRTLAAGVALLATLAQTLALLLFPVYVALALWQPTRTVHDRLAGTYLVPR